MKGFCSTKEFNIKKNPLKLVSKRILTTSFFAEKSTIGVIKNNTAYQDDEVTTDYLSWELGGTTLSVVTNYNLYSSHSLSETAWLYSRLDSVMQQLVAFYVVKTSAVVDVSQKWLMTYTIKLLQMRAVVGI